MPEIAPKDTAQLEDLIDLALQTGDREWFKELTGELNGKKRAIKIQTN